MRKNILGKVLSFILTLSIIFSSVGMTSFADSLDVVDNGDNSIRYETETTEDISVNEIATDDISENEDDEPAWEDISDGEQEEDGESIDVSDNDEDGEIVEDVSSGEEISYSSTIKLSGTVSVKIGNKTKIYKDDEAYSFLEESLDNYRDIEVTLKSDIVMTGWRSFGISGRNIKLNMNGYSIKGDDNHNFAMVTFTSHGNGDICVYGKGKIINTSKETQAIGVYASTIGTVTIKDVTIESYNKGLVLAEEVEELNFVSGEIKTTAGDTEQVIGIDVNDKYSHKNKNINIKGGKITVGVSDSGNNAKIAVGVYGYCNVNVSGGTIEVANEKNGVSARGVIIDGQTDYDYGKTYAISIKGGNIKVTNESTNASDNTYGVCSNVVSLTGGTVSAYANGDVRGIIGNYTVNVTGGTINVSTAPGSLFANTLYGIWSENDISAKNATINVSNNAITVAGIFHPSTDPVHTQGLNIAINCQEDPENNEKSVYGIFTQGNLTESKSKIRINVQGILTDAYGIYSRQIVSNSIYTTTISGTTVIVNNNDLAVGVYSNESYTVEDSSITVYGRNARGIEHTGITSDYTNYKYQETIAKRNTITVKGNDDASHLVGILLGKKDDHGSSDSISYSYGTTRCKQNTITVSADNNGNEVKAYGILGRNVTSPEYSYNTITVTNDNNGVMAGIYEETDYNCYLVYVIGNKIKTVTETDNLSAECVGIYVKRDSNAVISENTVTEGVSITTGSNASLVGIEARTVTTATADLNKNIVSITNKATNHGSSAAKEIGIILNGYDRNTISNSIVNYENKNFAKGNILGIRINPRSENGTVGVTDTNITVSARNLDASNNFWESAGIYVSPSKGERLFENLNVRVTAAGARGICFYDANDSVVNNVILRNSTIKAESVPNTNLTSEKSKAVAFMDEDYDIITIDKSYLISSDYQLIAEGPANELKITPGTAFEGTGSDNIKATFNGVNAPLTKGGIAYKDKNKNAVTDVYYVKYAKAYGQSEVIVSLPKQVNICSGTTVDLGFTKGGKTFDTTVKNVNWYINDKKVDAASYDLTKLKVKEAFAGMKREEVYSITWEGEILVGEEYYYSCITGKYRLCYGAVLHSYTKGYVEGVSGLKGYFKDGTDIQIVPVTSDTYYSVAPEMNAPEGYILERWTHYSAEDGFPSTPDGFVDVYPIFVPAGIYITTDYDGGISNAINNFDGNTLVLPDEIYTGYTITKDFYVFYGSRKLTFGTDYKVTYKDNKNVGTATITITGKGKYSGTAKAKFGIKKKDFATGVTVEISQTRYEYTKKSISPKITVTDKDTGKKLSSGTDYSVCYVNEAGAKVSSIVKPGAYHIIVKGKKNYTDSEISKDITVVSAKNVSKLSISGIEKSYNIKEYRLNYISVSSYPKPIVKDGNNELMLGMDYTLTASNTDKIGTATITVTGKGDYVGTKQITYKIVGESIAAKGVVFAWNKSAAEMKKLTYEGYTSDFVNPEFTLTLKDGTVLTKGTDYECTYAGKKGASASAAGEKTLTITGKGDYCGKIKKTYKINPVDISQNYKLPGGAYSKGKVTVSLGYGSSMATLGYDIRTDVYIGVTKNEIESLSKDYDYTVSYSNNKKVGTAYVTIKGKGNYKGSIKLAYVVSKAEIGKNIDLNMAKAGSSVSASQVTVYSNKGDKLTSKDYSVSYLNDRGEPIKGSTKLKAGEKITVVVTGKGNYGGAVSKTCIVSAKAISKATVKIANTNTDPVVKDGSKRLTYGVDYDLDYTYLYKDGKIIGYLYTVKGIGNYCGEKKVTLYLSGNVNWAKSELLN